MFKVSIVIPTLHFWRNPNKQQPINELYFATVLDERVAAAIDIIDLRELRNEGCKHTLDNVADFIPERDLYIHWIDRTGNFSEIINVTNQLRKKYINSKHVAGGFHVSNLQKECLNIFDAIVTGPGEESFIRIVNDCMSKKLKRVYSDNWSDVELYKYPFPKRHYLPRDLILDKELFQDYGVAEGTCAIFSRGCPYKCAYCCYNYPNTVCQLRNTKSIEEEIEYLKKEYNVKGITLRDELCIPVQRDGAIAQINAIGRNNIIWRGQGRVNVSKDLLGLAKQSGLVEISIGVESVSQKVLTIINKKQTIKEVKDFIELCKKLSIRVKASLMLGLPGEPKDIAKQTCDFLMETKPEYVNISGFCPFPGSPIYKNLKYYGIEYIDKDWGKYAHLISNYDDTDDSFGLPFKYVEKSQFGNTFTREEILNNIKIVKDFIREQKK